MKFRFPGIDFIRFDIASFTHLQKEERQSRMNESKTKNKKKEEESCGNFFVCFRRFDIIAEIAKR
jgi:hypothetical protein